MKILTVVGARPQFIKAAAVSREFSAREELQEVLVHTGQHFDANMSEVFFNEMQIPAPNYCLGINSLSHGAMTGRMMERIEEIIIAEKPDHVLVYGDTNSTLAAALAAKKLHVSVVHVEAGLRSFDMAMPEEINRILTDRISSVLYCPTEAAVRNLNREGYEHFDCRVVECGDVMEDAALFFAEKAREKSTILPELDLTDKDFLLCTLHRAENTDNSDRLNAIVDALNELAAEHTVVFPLHPRTRSAIKRQGLTLRAMLIPPVGYFDMLNLLSSASLVLTDSGGLQKEAYFFNKFCVTLRDQTEWVELVDNGFNVVVGANKLRMIEEAKRLLQTPFDSSVEIYGGGNAAVHIAKDLSDQG
jgi:UDP-GlcNAc3NAcA epimerase